ncbi:putative ankyrin repeat containing protein [Halotydeus destructor]|nr:putative ankyrin repeat containing protein [Halotydeus destructor]
MVVLKYKNLLEEMLKIFNLNLNAVDKHGYTPLDLAFMMNRNDIAESLMKNKAAFALTEDRVSSRLTIANFIKINANPNNIEAVLAMVETGYSAGHRPMTEFLKKMNLDKSNSKDAFNRLLELDPRIFKHEVDGGGTYLHLAVERNCIWLVQQLVEMGLDSNGKDYRDRTPLHRLAVTGVCDDKCNEIVQVLIRAGTNVNAMDSERNSAVKLSIVHRQTALTHCLLSAGANASTDCHGISLLHYCCIYNQLSSDIIEALSSKGCDANEKSGTGNTALHYLVMTMKSNGLNMEFINMLISFGSDVAIQNNAGDTPFSLAVIQGNNELISSFMSLVGMNDSETLINMKNRDGYTAFHLAILNPNVTPNVIRQMVNYGASVNEKTKNGLAPLHMVFTEPQNTEKYMILCANRNMNLTCILTHRVVQKQRAVFSILISESSLDINAVADSGFTALEMALKNGDYDFAVVMLNKFAIPTAGALQQIKLRPGIYAMLEALFRSGLRDFAAFFRSPRVRSLSNFAPWVSTSSTISQELKQSRRDIEKKSAIVPELKALALWKGQTMFSRQKLLGAIQSGCEKRIKSKSM